MVLSQTFGKSCISIFFQKNIGHTKENKNIKYKKIPKIIEIHNRPKWCFKTRRLKKMADLS